MPPLRTRVRGLLAVLVTAGLICPCGSLFAAAAAESAITGTLDAAAETVWDGRVIIEGVVTVPADARLTVRAGAEVLFRGEESQMVVNGALRAEGTPEKPISFAGEGGKRWAGILVSGSGEEILFDSCLFSNAVTALTGSGSVILVRGCRFEENETGVQMALEGRLELNGSRFRGNGTGLVGRMRSRVEVRDSSFTGGEGFGIVLDTAAGGRVTGCRFEGGKGVLLKQAADVFLGDSMFSGCGTGVAADQVRHDARLSGNRFEGGETGIVCVDFATPWIACCSFRGQVTGVVVRRFSNPMITNCLFEKNKRGLYAREKSDFAVRLNVFSGNDEAVVLDMSAYPRINGNDFSGNGKDIVLGIYMSADWEKRVGSGNLTRQEAQRQGTRNPAGVGAQREYSGVVDASGNWWGGKTTAEMGEKGRGADIGGIHDVHDTPEVTYPDFCEGSFVLDRVEYSPWADGPVEGAGPLPGGCGDLK